MSAIQQKLMYTILGLTIGFGNIVATSNGYPKIGICFGVISFYYLVRAIMIRNIKKEDE